MIAHAVLRSTTKSPETTAVANEVATKVYLTTATAPLPSRQPPLLVQNTQPRTPHSPGLRTAGINPRARYALSPPRASGLKAPSPG